VPLLEVREIDTFYGASHILHSLSLSLERGEIECILGRNGVGKTTLLRSVIGLTPPRRGAIIFKGNDITRMRVNRRARLGIGYVPQGRDIFSHLTVEENLRLGLGVRSHGPRSIPAHVYDLFPVLKQMRTRRGGDLSGGQQQQLAIARALVLEPSLLILDEPTEGIQPNLVQQIGDTLLALNRETGVTVLLVEQQLHFARRVASDFWILEKGRCVAGGPIDALTDELVRKHLSV